MPCVFLNYSRNLQSIKDSFRGHFKTGLVSMTKIHRSLVRQSFGKCLLQVIWKLHQNSNVVPRLQCGTKTPNVVPKLQCGTKTPNVVPRLPMWYQDSQCGTKTPNVVPKLQCGTKTPNVVSTVPNKTISNHVTRAHHK